MKSLKTKMMRIFKHNKWVAVTATILLLLLGGIGWKWSLHLAKESRKDDSIVTLALSSYMSGTDSISSEETQPYVSIEDGAAYWCSLDGEHIFGPCKKIYEEDVSSYSSNSIFRYVGENGLIGYAELASDEIHVLHEAVFTEASRMDEGSACVKEGEEVYFIDKEGERFTFGHYLSIYPFAEGQGSYARVEKENGTWSVINRSEEEMLSGFESINELPYITTVGSGMKDGKTIFFDIVEGCHTIWELDASMEIDRFYGMDYVIIVSKVDGTYGVNSIWSGKEIVPVEYEDISVSYIDTGTYQDITCFQCRKEDGSYDVFYDS